MSSSAHMTPTVKDTIECPLCRQVYVQLAKEPALTEALRVHIFAEHGIDPELFT